MNLPTASPMTRGSAAPPVSRYRILKTMTGPFAVLELEDGSIATTWVSEPPQERWPQAQRCATLHPPLVQRLQRYFAGQPGSFLDVPLPGWASAFHRRCWQACRSIPRGQTRSYAQLAAMADSPRGARAAGQAMRHNPLPVIVPCHRVVATGGRMGGFGGSCDPQGPQLAIKVRLLELEAAGDTLPSSSPMHRADLVP